MDTQDRKESFVRHRRQPSRPRIGSWGLQGLLLMYNSLCVPMEGGQTALPAY